MRAIAFTSYGKAELIDLADDRPLQSGEILGRTLVSLTSPGTELMSGYFGSEFPDYPGYANIATVVETGPDVVGISAGDTILCMETHREYVRTLAADATLVPQGLAPEVAAFARIMGISMSTLNIMTANPPSRVLVTGLGPVGNLAAQIFKGCGFTVTATDPHQERRDALLRYGVTDVRASIHAEGPEIKDKVRTHIECSGHERAVLDGVETLGLQGEVFLVGVPWTARDSSITAQHLLKAMFYRYVSVHSGWEWQVPRHPASDQANSIASNFEIAMDWLREGRIRTDGLATLYRPDQADEVYRGLADRSLPTIAALFDWRQ
jgi:threonine dehydrogenase-like Zn-dependent dehydrogenase